MTASKIRCDVRDNLVQRRYSLLDHLSSASSVMATLAGNGEVGAFAKAESDCRQLHVAIQQAKDRLAAHRAEHGC